jgi:hypothetical protein
MARRCWRNAAVAGVGHIGAVRILPIDKDTADEAIGAICRERVDTNKGHQGGVDVVRVLRDKETTRGGRRPQGPRVRRRPSQVSDITTRAGGAAVIGIGGRQDG